MQRHWREVAPPLNICMAAYVGFKPKPVRNPQGGFDGDAFETAMAELFGR
jgi:hypothetical protein